MSDTPSYDPTPQPSSSSKGLPPALANLSDSTLLWTQVGGGVVAALSTFFTWYTIEVTFFGTVTGNGYSSGSSPYGVFILLLGLATAALAFIKVRNIQVQGLDKLPAFLPLILAGLMTLLAFIKWIDILTTNTVGADVSSGFGIWLALIASLVTLGAAVMPVLKARMG